MHGGQFPAAISSAAISKAANCGARFFREGAIFKTLWDII